METTKPCNFCADGEGSHLLHLVRNPSPVWVCPECAKVWHATLKCAGDDFSCFDLPTLEGPVR